MAIPKEILQIARPSSTIIKKRGNRYVVIKRTSKRVGKRVVPVELGTIGEIVDGRYVESVIKRTPKTIDIKDYGEVALCNALGKGLLDELLKVYDLSDAKRLYAIAVLRAAYGDIKNRDLQLHYETSFVSEMYPGVHLSEQAVSAFLQEIGQSYSRISEFMRKRVELFAGKNIVVDGMLKDYNSEIGTMSEFSRKARTKGSKDLSLLYAFDPQSKEPIAAKPYAGNMLDQTTIRDFVEENKIEKGLMIFDKGFWNEGLLEEIDMKKDLAYVIPLKQNSKFIKNYEMDTPTEVLKGYEDRTILYKKVRMKNGKYLYAFRDPKMASDQEIAYVQQRKKQDKFDAAQYAEKKSLFGLIVFKSKANLDPLTIYLAYSERWSIETFFNLYKNIMDRDTVNVHGDYRLYATEFINFLSTIISSRVKNLFAKKELNKHYSYKQIFKYLSKCKKVKVGEKSPWRSCTKPKYIDDLVETLGCIVD